MIWQALNGTASALSADLQDYASVPDSKLLEAWDEGLKRARDRAQTVDMHPVLQKANKWDAPWPASLSESVALAEELITEDDLDHIEAPGGSQISPAAQMQPPSTSASGSTRDQSVSELLIAADEASIRSSVLDSLQEVGAGLAAAESIGRAKICPTVDVPDKGPVFKMRLITELNSCSRNLSLDRLRRVQVRAPQGASSTTPESGNDVTVGLFDDVAMQLADSSSKPCVYLARIQKMFKVTSTGGRVDFQNPVSLAEDARDPGVRVIVKYYKALDGERLTYNMGGMKTRAKRTPCL